MRFEKLLAFGVTAAFPILASAQSITPLSTFGSNGYLAPGSSTYLGTNNTERGLAYGNGHLYLVSRASGNNIRILDSGTGADLGGLSTTGISGGTYAINEAAVGGDGAIYISNLQAAATTANYTIYKYATETSTPTAIFNSTVAAGSRLGDTLAAFGSGASTILASGFGTGGNGYLITNGTTGASSAVTVTGTNTGDFRTGLTFGGDANTVIGTQTGGAYRDTTYAGTTGTLVGTGSLVGAYNQAGGERLLAYTTIAGTPYLAAQSTGDSHVSVYNITDPLNPVFVATGLAVPSGTTPAGNGNATGQLAWGPSSGNTATLYTLSTNQGIDAYTVVVPEPTSLGLISIFGLTLAGRRRA